MILKQQHRQLIVKAECTEEHDLVIATCPMFRLAFYYDTDGKYLIHGMPYDLNRYAAYLMKHANVLRFSNC